MKTKLLAKPLVIAIALSIVFAVTASGAEIHTAVQNADLTKIKSILKANHKAINSTNEDGETPLHSAAWDGHYKIVGLLLDNKADPNIRDASGHTALYGAAWNGQLETLTTLVKGGTDTKSEPEKSTPLHAAAWQGHSEVVRALLDFGANANAQDSDGSTPLHKAAWRGHDKVVNEGCRGIDTSRDESEKFCSAKNQSVNVRSAQVCRGCRKQVSNGGDGARCQIDATQNWRISR